MFEKISMLSPVARKKGILGSLLGSFPFLLIKNVFLFQDAFCMSASGAQFGNLAEMAR